jgi:hypothetical protein
MFVGREIFEGVVDSASSQMQTGSHNADIHSEETVILISEVLCVIQRGPRSLELANAPESCRAVEMRVRKDKR